MSPSFLKTLIQSISLIFVLLLVFGEMPAQKLDSLFKSEEIIQLELRADFSAIQEDRQEDPNSYDGELIQYEGETEVGRFTIKVKPRGNFRLNPTNCKFPPLLVNFKKGEVKNTLFDNQNKLKLVTPCQLEEDVFEEYLIYKMYNLVSDVSHRVRLANILYYDTGRDKKVFERTSFFIEDEDHVAERNDGFERDSFITPFDLNEDNVKKLGVFQFIIGNKDWYITSRHNIVIVQPNDTTQAPYALPYDFDFASFVNADYTKPKGVPDEMLENRRVYKGLCYSSEEFYEIFDFYKELRPEFEALIMNMEGISKFSRKQAVRYIDYFYEVTESNQLFTQEFLEQCKTRKDYFQFEKEE
jgi:hypothetical protein